MVKHIVLFQWKKEHLDQIGEARDRILAMKGKVDVIREIEAGVDFLHSGRSYDLGLVVTLDSREDLAVYNDHPDHKPVKTFLAPLYSGAVAVDFEV